MGKKEKKAKAVTNDIFEKSANKRRDAKTSQKDATRLKKQDGASKRRKTTIYLLSVLVAISSVLVFVMLQSSSPTVTHVKPHFRVLKDTVETEESKEKVAADVTTGNGLDENPPTPGDESAMERESKHLAASSAISQLLEQDELKNEKDDSIEGYDDALFYKPAEALPKPVDTSSAVNETSHRDDEQEKLRDAEDGHETLRQPLSEASSDRHIPSEVTDVDEAGEPQQEVPVESVQKSMVEPPTEDTATDDYSAVDGQEENEAAGQIKEDTGVESLSKDAIKQDKQSSETETNMHRTDESRTEDKDIRNLHQESARIDSKTVDVVGDYEAGNEKADGGEEMEDAESETFEDRKSASSDSASTETSSNDYPLKYTDQKVEGDSSEESFSSSHSSVDTQFTAEGVINSDTEDSVDTTSNSPSEANQYVRSEFNEYEEISEDSEWPDADLSEQEEEEEDEDEEEEEEEEEDASIVEKSSEAGSISDSTVLPYHADEKYVERKNVGDGFTQISNGVKKQIIKDGSGPAIQPGDTITIHCIGYLDTNPPKKFWSTKDSAQKPFTFAVGKRQVIKGWDEGAKTMRLHERSKIQIEPSKAYGKYGFEAWNIPPNARLILEMEVIEHKRLKNS